MVKKLDQEFLREVFHCELQMKCPIVNFNGKLKVKLKYIIFILS